MRTRAIHLLCLAWVVAAALAADAQEGHPLTGTWSGEWRPASGDSTHLTLVMEWDGPRITATINPGPDAVRARNVALDVTSWTVRIEAESTDAAGHTIAIIGEGRIANLGSWHRTLSGSWTQGTVTGEFRLTRN